MSRFKYFSPCLAAFLLVLVTFVPVYATPNASPPGGNVDANFNTVTSNSVTSGAVSTGKITIGSSSLYANGNALFLSAGSFQMVGANGGVGDIHAIGPLSVGGDLDTNGNFSVVKNLDVAGNGLFSGTLNAGTMSGSVATFGTITNPTPQNGGAVYVNDDLTVTGHLKTLTIGDFQNVTGPKTSIAANTLSGATVACPTGYLALSCGYFSGISATNNWSFTSLLNSGSGCTVGVKNANASGAANSIYATAVCFNPNI